MPDTPGPAWNPDVPEEKRKEIEAHCARHRAYSNSWEKIEKEGFGQQKTRQPCPETDFSNLDMRKYDWDFQIKGVPYDVYYIDGYAHRCDAYLYFCPKDAVPSHENLKPFDMKWEPVEWNFEVNESKSWKYKWDEIRTSAGWEGTLFRNRHVFHTVRSDSANGVWNELQHALTTAKSHTICFHNRDWKNEAIGRKIWYHGSPCIITGVNDYNEGVSFTVVGDNPEKLICSPANWTADDEICSKQRWDDDYAKGCIVEWYSPHIGWFRN